VDNLYSNVALFKYLYTHCKTTISGTWREGKEIPNCLSLSSTQAKENVKTQENNRLIAAVDCTNNGQSTLVLTGCAFLGTKGKPVHFLTTGRFNWNLIQGGSKNKTRLDAIHDYNSFMHGNDILDAVLAQYSVYFRSKRWTIRLASWVIDVAVACGYINANYFGLPRSTDCLHAAWIEKLIDELVEKSGIDFNASSNNTNLHFPVKVAKKDRKHCKICYQQTGKQIKSSFECGICKITLCIGKECFKLYHT